MTIRKTTASCWKHPVALINARFARKFFRREGHAKSCLVLLAALALVAHSAIGVTFKQAQPPEEKTLPSISGSAAATGIYGLKKLAGAYTGPALRVIRASDKAETDIGFKGADLDTAAAIAFSGSSALKIAVLYDQSGHGNHLTQTVAASQPTLSMAYQEPYIKMSGGVLDIPATLTADRTNVSMFAVMREVSSMVTEGCFYMGTQPSPGTKGTVDLGIRGLISSFGSQPVWDSTAANLVPNDGRTVATASRSILGLVSSGTALTVHRDGATAVTTTHPTPKLMNVGGRYGGVPGFGARQDMYAWVFYPAALNDTETTEVKTALRNIFATNSWTPALNVGMQGDSKTFGVATPNNLTLARYTSTSLAEKWGTNFMIRSLSIGGHQIKGDKGAYNPKEFIEPTAINVMNLYEGINDLNLSNATAANIWEYYQIFVANCHAHGWNRVVCCTIVPTKNGTVPAETTRETQRVLLNQMIRANNGHLFDAIVDFDAIPEFGPAGHAPKLYFPDDLHETEPAYAIEGPLVAKGINAAAAAPELPGCTTTPLIAGPAQVGQNLSCSTGKWVNNPTSYTYQWKYFDTSAAIPGATAATYTLVARDAGHPIHCCVTATNANGSSVCNTAETAAVAK